MHHRTKTATLADALDILARDIQSEDGVANAAIQEGADRIRELDLYIREVIGDNYNLPTCDKHTLINPDAQIRLDKWTAAAKKLPFPTDGAKMEMDGYHFIGNKVFDGETRKIKYEWELATPEYEGLDIVWPESLYA